MLRFCGFILSCAFQRGHARPSRPLFACVSRKSPCPPEASCRRSTAPPSSRPSWFDQTPSTFRPFPWSRILPQRRKGGSVLRCFKERAKCRTVPLRFRDLDHGGSRGQCSKGTTRRPERNPRLTAYLIAFSVLPLQVDCRLRFPFEPFALPSPVSIFGGAARRRCIARATQF